MEFLPKLKIEVVVMDEDVPGAINAIIRGARTGDIGDGKIFVIPIVVPPYTATKLPF